MSDRLTTRCPTCGHMGLHSARFRIDDSDVECRFCISCGQQARAEEFAVVIEFDGMTGKSDSEASVLVGRTVRIDIDAFALLCVLSNLQLACRHPGNKGATRPIAEQIGRIFQEAISITPELAALTEAGWREAFDVPVEEEEEDEVG